MKLTGTLKKSFFCLLCLVIAVLWVHSQPVTGIWKGKMGNYNIELKLVRKGDSLIGTSYYYDSRSHVQRYSVKGYFDDKSNDVIWWDDVLIENSGSQHAGQLPLLAVADFNCPGEGIMKLDGSSSRKEDVQKEKKQLHLIKSDGAPIYPDEWDFLIENYAFGVIHPEVVDSIEQYAFHGPPTPVEKPVAVHSTKPPATGKESKPIPVYQPAPAPVALTNSEKFTRRTKILQQVIPVKGDSIEIRFYDNAEIDGDSIAVFLNGTLLKEHILLAENAYTLKIALTDLQADNELVMVAENLGTIPPNTSLMVAIVEDKRYEAHLQSTEGSSALVRLVKP